VQARRGLPTAKTTRLTNQDIDPDRATAVFEAQGAVMVGQSFGAAGRTNFQKVALVTPKRSSSGGDCGYQPKINQDLVALEG